MSHAGDVALSCCLALVDEFARAGVRHACISPGSRSAPIALALARHPSIEAHVHLDERSSAFFALGVAKATGLPALATCTSGTAAVNFHPAVVEADRSCVPLILLTADRPPELRGTGANQTIDQIDLYGRSTRLFVDAPVPAPGSEPRFRSLAARALSAARGRPFGPVHLNLPFREPLVPESHIAAAQLGDPATQAPPPVEAPEEDDVAALADAASSVERGLVMVGELRSGAGRPDALDSIASFAQRAGWPLLAEPTSGLRRPGDSLSAAQHLLGSPFGAEHVPDLVLQIGAAPTTRASLALASAARRLLVLDAGAGPSDPSASAQWACGVDPGLLAAAAASRVRPADRSPWCDVWSAADLAAARAANETIDASVAATEVRAVRDVAAATPPAAILACGSSTPIRDLDAFMLPRTGGAVLANRGASGIDGFVSTVFGAAAGSGRPVVAILGDLTFLHDASGFLWHARRAGGPPVVLVVLDNDGGGIFDFLPQAELPEHESLFVTPSRADFASVVAAAECDYAPAATADEAAAAVRKALVCTRPTVVHLRVDKGADRQLRELIRSKVNGAVS